MAFDYSANLSRCRQLAVLPLAPPDSESPRRVTVQLASNRARIQSVAFAGETVTPRDVEQREFTFEIDAAADFDRDAPSVKIDWTDEPPVVANTVWDPPPKDASDPTPAELTTEEIFARREERVREVERDEAAATHANSRSEPKAAAMRFFYELDRMSHPRLLSPKAARLMNTLTYLLSIGLKTRARLRIGCADVSDDEPASKTVEFALGVGEDICELFEHFGSLDDPKTYEKIDRAFERFTCGDLEIPRAATGDVSRLETHGAPNGLNYFLLAEFALFMIGRDEASARHAVWEKVLPVFVRTAEMFLELYWNGGCRTFGSYGFAWRDERRFSTARLQRLRNSYDGVTQAGCAALSERFSLLCAHALRDDIGREAHHPNGEAHA